MAAANAMLGNPFTTDDLFQLCTAFEGHPDNAAPAFLGGLTASFMHEGRAVAVPFSPDPAWCFVAVIPNYEVRTEEARRIVRRDIDLSAAVHTMSHAIAMVRGLETGDEALVGAACADGAEAFVAKVRVTWPDFAARVPTVCHEGTTVTVED